MTVGKCLTGSILCLTAWAFQSAPVAAHAYIVATLPSANSSSAAGSTLIEMTFDEPVTLDSPNPVVVIDPSGVGIPCTPAAHIDPSDATNVLCRLSRPLGSGRYLVAWRVTSADTHVVHGSFAFGSGAGAPVERETRSTFDPSAILPAALRWIMLYGTIAAVGSYVFATFVVGRGRTRDEPAMTRCCRFAMACGLVSLVASVPALAVQALAASGGVWHGLAPIFTTAFETRYGYAWLLRDVSLVAFVAALRARSPAAAGIGLAGGCGALAAFTLSGHAMGGVGAAVIVKVCADFVHLASATVWAGGLVAFVVAMPLVNTRAAIAAFSPFALAATMLIVLSGIFASIVHVGSWVSLVNDWYGRLVIVKILLFGFLLALGARNLARGRNGVSLGTFSDDAAAEVVLVSIVILASAVLIGLAPPHRTQPAISSASRAKGFA